MTRPGVQLALSTLLLVFAVFLVLTAETWFWRLMSLMLFLLITRSFIWDYERFRKGGE